MTQQPKWLEEIKERKMFVVDLTEFSKTVEQVSIALRDRSKLLQAVEGEV